MADADLATRIKAVSAAALNAAAELVAEWLPDGRRQGSEWVSTNPVRGDRRAGSFGVSLTTGRWNDYADGDAHGGDLVSLLAYLQGIKQAAAARLIDRRLALGIFDRNSAAGSAVAHDLVAEAARRRRHAETSEREQWASVATLAQRLWHRAGRADPEHSYLRAKQLPPVGVRQADDALLVPLFDGGSLINVQRISADGGKRFLSGGRVRGGYAPLGKIVRGKPLYICEGWATGTALHMDSGAAVACAMSANNLEPVARELRQRYGDQVELVIAGDDDRGTPGNPGRTAATTAAMAAGARVVFPEWPADAPASLTDFSDLHVWHIEHGEGEA